MLRTSTSTCNAHAWGWAEEYVFNPSANPPPAGLHILDQHNLIRGSFFSPRRGEERKKRRKKEEKIKKELPNAPKRHAKPNQISAHPSLHCNPLTSLLWARGQRGVSSQNFRRPSNQGATTAKPLRLYFTHPHCGFIHAWVTDANKVFFLTFFFFIFFFSF